VYVKGLSIELERLLIQTSEYWVSEWVWWKSWVATDQFIARLRGCGVFNLQDMRKPGCSELTIWLEAHVWGGWESIQMLESHMQARGELTKIRNQKREVQCMLPLARSVRRWAGGKLMRILHALFGADLGLNNPVTVDHGNFLPLSVLGTTCVLSK
jgi:hypothetical protein